MTTQLARTVSLLLAVALVLGGCAGSIAQADRPPLKVGYILWGGWYPILIAKERGLFEKYGVKVEPLLYEIYSDIPVDFAAGKLDGGLFSLFDTLPLESRQPGGGVKVVMVTDDTVGADAIVAGPEIRSVADLRGKRLAVLFDSYAEVLVREMLKANGLSAADVTLVDLLPEQVPNELGRTIDAGHTFEPYLSRVLAQGYHTIFSSADRRGLMPNVLALRGSIVQERPQDVQAFINAWFEAQAWWQTHPDEGDALIASVTGQNPEDISLKGIQLYTRTDNRQVFTRGTETSSLYRSAQINLDFLITSGAVSRAPDIDRLLDPSFLQ